MIDLDNREPSQPFHILFIFSTQSYIIIESVINPAPRFERKQSLTGVITPRFVFQDKSRGANLKI